MGEELSVHFADKAMFTAEPAVGDKHPRVYLLSATPDPLGSMAAMCMMYEGKVIRNLADVTDEQRKHYWRESFKTHLKAPWESIDFHFMIENVPRSFTHQIVRQRTAVYAQESMRFAVKDDLLENVMPGPSINAASGPQMQVDDIKATYWETIEVIEKAYKDLIEAGVPAEDARGILPHDTLTRLHYKTNLRNLAEHLGNRLCTQAQFHWRIVAAQLRQSIREYSLDNYRDGQHLGWQFEYIAASRIFQPVCFTHGRCPFHADFDRGCTIRKRVDEGRFDEIEPKEWLADPRAAFVK